MRELIFAPHCDYTDTCCDNMHLYTLGKKIENSEAGIKGWNEKTQLQKDIAVSVPLLAAVNVQIFIGRAGTRNKRKWDTTE